MITEQPGHPFALLLLKMYVVMVKQEEPSDWEDSWKLSGAELEPKDTTEDETPTAGSSSTETTVMMRLNEVFLPGWSDSWLLSAAPLEEEEERHKNWKSCWAYRQQIRWVGAECPSPNVQHLSGMNPFMFIPWLFNMSEYAPGSQLGIGWYEFLTVS